MGWSRRCRSATDSTWRASSTPKHCWTISPRRSCAGWAMTAEAWRCSIRTPGRIPPWSGWSRTRGLSSLPGRSCNTPGRAMQRAVLRQRSGPRAVSPASGRLRAFVPLLRPRQRPSPTGRTERGVGPLWANHAGQGLRAASPPFFCPPERAWQTGFGGQCRGSIFVLDKVVTSPPHTPSRNAGRGLRFYGS